MQELTLTDRQVAALQEMFLAANMAQARLSAAWEMLPADVPQTAQLDVNGKRLVWDAPDQSDDAAED